MRVTTFLLIAALVLVGSGDPDLMAQRQGGPAPQGRQGGAAPPAGRQAGPGGPARDRPATEGTGVIRGKVVAGDTNAPVRRAEVQATVGGQRARTALTDADGQFEFRDLPAGSVTVRASKTGFVAQQFGQRSPFSSGDPVVLADGQQVIANFTLLRGGAITGRVFDDGGDPIAGVRVTVFRAQFTPNGRRLVATGSGGITDDTGAYRVYGLAPGGYYVSATSPRNSSTPLSIAGAPVAYASTYFPGTIDAGAAERVTLGPGQDQSNIDFALTAVPTVRISGVVLTSSGTPAQAMVNLQSALPSISPEGERRTFNTAADGSFMVSNVIPGTYVLEVSERVRGASATPEGASMPLVVGGGDIAGLSITTSRGATVTGTVATEDGTRVDLSGIRVTAPPARNTSGGPTPRAQVTSTGTFEMDGLVAARSLRFEQLPSGWIVKSVTAGTTDVMDVPLDFRGRERASVRVVLTDRITQLTGTVRSDTPPRGAGVLVFPADKAKWTAPSRYVKTARAGDAGQFTIRALPGEERYLVVALDYLENGEHLDPAFLERVRPLGTSVLLADGEQTSLDLPLNPHP